MNRKILQKRQQLIVNKLLTKRNGLLRSNFQKRREILLNKKRDEFNHDVLNRLDKLVKKEFPVFPEIEFPQALFPKELQKITGEVKADISNFPDIQKVRGSLEVTNLPNIQNVKLINDYTNVHVNNLPDVSTIQGSVKISNFPEIQNVKLLNELTDVKVVNLPKEQKVEVINLPLNTGSRNKPPFDSFPYLAVRLFDGRNFIDDFGGSSKGGEFTVSTPASVPFIRTDGKVERALIDTAGHLQIDVLTMPDVELSTGDIEIGAVEIKDHDSDARANVGVNGLEVDVKAMPVVTTVSGTTISLGSQNVSLRQKVTTNDLIITLDEETVTVTSENFDIRDLDSNSDSVTAVQSGQWDITDITGSVSLPTGAATEATLNTLAVESGGNLAEIKTNTDNIPSLGQTLMVNSVPVTIASNQSIITVSGTGAATSALQLPDGHNVTVDNVAGAAAVNIQDGGNTITVDGTVITTATDLDIRNLTSVSDSVEVKQATGTNLHAVIDSGTITSITNAVAVTGTFWQATQPVSIASMPSTPVTGTFWPITQPISGTVTANLSATDNAVLDAIALGYGAEGSALASGILLQGDDGTDRTNVLVDTTGHLQIDVITAPTTAVTGTFWQTTQPVSLASVPSHAVTNAGTFAVQESGAALTALQLIDNMISGSEAQVDIVAALPAGTNVIGEVLIAPETVVYNGTKTVPTVTAETIAGSQACHSVTIKALSTNTVAVYVGATGCTTANGFELLAGESVSLDIANLATVFVISGSAAQVVRYIAI